MDLTSNEVIAGGSKYYLIQCFFDSEIGGLGNYKNYNSKEFVEAESFAKAKEKILNMEQHKHDKNFNFIDLTIR